MSTLLKSVPIYNFPCLSIAPQHSRYFSFEGATWSELFLKVKTPTPVGSTLYWLRSSFSKYEITAKLSHKTATTQFAQKGKISR